MTIFSLAGRNSNIWKPAAFFFACKSQANKYLPNQPVLCNYLVLFTLTPFFYDKHFQTFQDVTRKTLTYVVSPKLSIMGIGRH